MPNPTRVRLRDTFVLDGALHHSKNGYISAFAKVARTGIQVYRGFELGKPEMDAVRVYRPESEVFRADVMRKMAHIPVTLLHPPVMVDANNWGKYAKGQTSEPIVRDGDYVRVPVTIMDGGTVKAVKDGVRELSLGYDVSLDWTPGSSPTGEQFDASISDIDPNHLSVVPSARGGSRLRLGDAAPPLCPHCGARVSGSASACPACGYEFDEEDTIKDATTTETSDATRVADKGQTMAHSMILDGQPIEVADKLTASVIEKHSADLRKRVTDAETAAKAIADALESEKKAHATALDTARKEVSAKDGEIVVLKKQVADSALTPDQLDALIADRAAVIDAATPMLEKGFVFAGKTIDDIRKAAVTAKLGDAAKALDAAGVGGAFTALSAIKTTDGTTRLAGALLDHNRKTHDASTLSVADAAYAEMIKEMQAGRSARN